VHQTTSWHHYIPDLFKDAALYRANQLYLVWLVGSVLLPVGIGYAIYGTGQGALLGLLWGGLLPLVSVQHVTWMINSVCHVWGTRPYCTGGDAIDKGRNNVLVAIVTLGEGWHNHHHAFPSTADNQFRFYQFDPSAWVIYTLAALGLARDIKKPSRAVREQSRVRRERLPWIFTTGWRSGRDPRLGQQPEIKSTLATGA
jgi:stearoyl-CoA desaturase (Delta-9 desaturase)